MTRVWLLYGRSKRVGTFLGVLFVSGFATALFVSRYSPGVSVARLCFTTVRTFAHRLTEHGSPGYTMYVYYLSNRDIPLMYWFV